MGQITIRARNFRAHQALDWSPSRVCVLSGANGAGKSTALQALQFLAVLYRRGVEAAYRQIGPRQVQTFAARDDGPATLELQVGDLRWVVRLPEGEGRVLRRLMGEELWRGGTQVMLAPALEQDIRWGDQALPRDEDRCCARLVVDRGEAPWLQPLADALAGIRVYASYGIHLLQRPDRVGGPDTFLAGSADNLWSVLATWRSAPRTSGGQLRWVIDAAKRAFPGLIEDIEFERGVPFLFQPDALEASQGMSPDRVADGLLVGLAHLTAIAGARPGSLLAFDEVENQLHPHAIRSILAAMRARAEQHDLTVVLTTHSPVVLDEFRHDPGQIHVLGHGRSGVANPAPLDQLEDPDWLATDWPGGHYSKLAFASPLRDVAHAGGEA